MRNFFSPQSRWSLPLLVVVGFALSCIGEYTTLLNYYQKSILIMVGINIILCVSLNLVNGYMGEFSVGHAGFMALGAYASAVITVKWLPPSFYELPLAVLGGGLVAAILGFPLALLSFKTRGDYLAIITLAFLMIVLSAITNIDYVGGPRGMNPPLLTNLPWIFFWVVVTLWCIRNLIYSKFGRAIVAIREDEIAANAMGVRVREGKMLAFCISAFFGGVGGALFAHLNLFIDTKSFDINTSTIILVMVYLGGIASLGGSIIGAVAFTILFELLHPLGTWRMVIMSSILVLLMLFRPRGIMGLREFSWFLPKSELPPAKKP